VRLLVAGMCLFSFAPGCGDEAAAPSTSREAAAPDAGGGVASWRSATRVRGEDGVLASLAAVQHALDTGDARKGCALATRHAMLQIELPKGTRGTCRDRFDAYSEIVRTFTNPKPAEPRVRLVGRRAMVTAQSSGRDVHARFAWEDGRWKIYDWFDVVS
jgi:hypothetical protein